MTTMIVRSDIIQQARDFLARFDRQANGWGDTWNPNYFPANRPQDIPLFDGSVHVNENVCTDTSGYDVSVESEEFAVLACDLFNNGPAIIEGLLRMVEKPGS